MKYVLVLQWPATSEADFDALISMEDLLEADLPDAHGLVDGHDFGAGEMNIFVHTDRPLEAFRDAMTSLGPDPRWAGYERHTGWPMGIVMWSFGRRRLKCSRCRDAEDPGSIRSVPFSVP